MPQRSRPLDERWLERVDASGGPDACHPWRGCLANGYGLIRDESMKMIGTHVYAWVRVNGPVPPGKQIDHKCHNADPTCAGGPTCPHRACCNERHLRATTVSENVRSGRSPRLSSARITTRNRARKGGPQQGGRKANRGVGA